MKKWIVLLLIILTYSLNVQSQTLVQTYIDSCDGKTYVVSFPLPTSVISISVRNKIKTFTYAEAQSGAISSWVNSILSTPCPVPIAAAVTQTQVATSVAKSAANVAASANTSTPTTDASSSNSTSESSSSGSPEESKSEEKKEEKSKGNKQQRANPLLIASDLTTAQNPDNTLSAIMNIGVSKNSMIGDESYGVTGMIWSNLNQFAISSRYTKITLNDQSATTLSNTSLTTAYATGDIFVFLGYSEVLAKPKLGILGYNINLGAMFLTGDIQTYIYSITMFYMKSIVLNNKISITPSMFASGTPLLYSQRQLSVDSNLNIMCGSTFDYAITKKFKFGFDYKISFGTTSNIPILNMVMIGSKIQL